MKKTEEQMELFPVKRDWEAYWSRNLINPGSALTFYAEMSAFLTSWLGIFFL